MFDHFYGFWDLLQLWFLVSYFIDNVLGLMWKWFCLIGYQACAPNPYVDPYYGGMMTAFGQPLVYTYLIILSQIFILWFVY